MRCQVLVTKPDQVNGIASTIGCHIGSSPSFDMGFPHAAGSLDILVDLSDWMVKARTYPFKIVLDFLSQLWLAYPSIFLHASNA